MKVAPGSYLVKRVYPAGAAGTQTRVVVLGQWTPSQDTHSGRRGCLPMLALEDCAGPIERERLRAVALAALFARVDDVAFRKWAYGLGKPVQCGAERGMVCLRRLDFDPDERSLLPEKQIDFVPVAVPEEGETARQTLIVSRLEQFEDDEILEDLADEWIARELLLRLNSEQISEQTSVREVDFR